MARFGFDISETEYNERGEFEIIPKGTEVTLKATEAEEKKTTAPIAAPSALYNGSLSASVCDSLMPVHS